MGGFLQAEDNFGRVKRECVLADVADGLNYLHHELDQMVVHEDIKSQYFFGRVDKREAFWAGKIVSARGSAQHNTCRWDAGILGI